ncbi:DotI/IcmL/TraM family protein [Legionella micdadei]|uniref:Macrophage killing protein with similarity to conjugation protein n=2 Tax=Legionella micdadei TaxID=451 RepID=A0A098GGX9_LEGMI|nr:DotI/IcmL/TraM family protein [Legionella micdadei]KTD26567.1 IcmL-like protein [Legionella micdadei]CEG61714.1 conserved exported protein of unknown function [Legionella micdadei]SCY21319.1 Macrophage killing protein with similarity to conjugation protein [Legionella micdadei]
MKKSMLCAGLMTVLTTTVYAESNDGTVSIHAEQVAPMAANVQLAQNSASTGSPATAQAREQIIASDEVKTPPTQGLQLPTDKGTQTPSTTDQLPTGKPTPATETPNNSGTPSSGTPTSSLNTGSSQSSAVSTGTNKATTVSSTATSNNKATGGVTTPNSTSTSTTAPTSNTTSSTPSATPPAPGATTNTTPATTGTSNTAAPTAAPPQPLNCNYRIPAETTHIEQTIVMKWAEKAAEQSFDFDYNTMDSQLAALKSCYTEQGWQGFNDALQKSGNLNAIKSQQLTVSSMVNGESKITELKDNQWKVIIPMQVVYQNDKEKLTQPLTVNLVVGRKISGDLGIMQMIAIPSQTTSTGNEAPTTGSTATPTTQQPIQP